MKRSDLAVALEWGGTLGAAGLWVFSATWKDFPNLTAILVFASDAYLFIGVGLLLIALLARRSRTGRLFPKTLFNAPILLFLLGALIGWYSAYNQELGLAKLFFLLAAIAIFFLLVEADAPAVRRFVLCFVLLATMLAILNILQYDFAKESALPSFLAPIGRLLNRVLPKIGIKLPNPNTVAGILELALSFNLWWLYESLSNGGKTSNSNDAKNQRGSLVHRDSLRRFFPAGLALLTLACILLGLLFTRSRGALLALVAMVGVALVGVVGSVLGKKLLKDSRLADWAAKGVMLAAALVGLGLYGVVLAQPNWLENVPWGGAAEVYTQVFQDSFYQARDYFFTGAGPGAFQMVYSTYSLLIHVGFIPDAHNLYLQVWLEQGLLGLVALLWMAGGAIYLLLRDGKQKSWTVRAAGWAIVAILLHGLTDAPLYGYEPWSTLFLFIPFGLLVSGGSHSNSATTAPPAGSPTVGNQKMWRYARAALVAAILGSGIIWHREILSIFLANRGAVEQTKIELGRYAWPEWPLQDEVRRQVDLTRPVQLFERALDLDPLNPTANRRLGMITLSTEDYSRALAYLDAAYASTPDDNATRQLLGEAYIVNGRLEEGIVLWASVNQAQGQLDLRKWWYGHIGDEQRLAWISEAKEKAMR